VDKVFEASVASNEHSLEEAHELTDAADHCNVFVDEDKVGFDFYFGEALSHECLNFFQPLNDELDDFVEEFVDLDHILVRVDVGAHHEITCLEKLTAKVLSGLFCGKTDEILSDEVIHLLNMESHEILSESHVLAEWRFMLA
jgi:hypothetical protein